MLYEFRVLFFSSCSRSNLIIFVRKILKKYFSLFAGNFSFPPLTQQRYNVLLVKMLKKNSGALKPGFSSENTSCRYYYSRCSPHSPALPIRITFFHGVSLFLQMYSIVVLIPFLLFAGSLALGSSGSYLSSGTLCRAIVSVRCNIVPLRAYTLRKSRFSVSRSTFAVYDGIFQLQYVFYRLITYQFLNGNCPIRLYSIRQLHAYIIMYLISPVFTRD